MKLRVDFSSPPLLMSLADRLMSTIELEDDSVSIRRDDGRTNINISPFSNNSYQERGNSSHFMVGLDDSMYHEPDTN
jgi:hypothetical protein